jgi:hypothetical protein
MFNVPEPPSAGRDDPDFDPRVMTLEQWLDTAFPPHDSAESLMRRLRQRIADQQQKIADLDQEIANIKQQRAAIRYYYGEQSDD